MTSADFRKRAQYRLAAALTDIPRDAAMFDDLCSIKLRVVLVDLNACCHHSLTKRRTNPIGDETMPLVRVELPIGKSAEYRAAVGEAIQQAMHAALKVPLEERFHIFTEHAPGNLVIDQTYLGIERSADAIVVQLTLNEGRDAEVKRGFYRTLACGLRECVGLRPEDLVVNLVEVKRENWSFGNGKAQFV
jgi:4-oxalocrotonate tautomerase